MVVAVNEMARVNNDLGLSPWRIFHIYASDVCVCVYTGCLRDFERRMAGGDAPLASNVVDDRGPDMFSARWFSPPPLPRMSGTRVHGTVGRSCPPKRRRFESPGK